LRKSNTRHSRRDSERESDLNKLKTISPIEHSGDDSGFTEKAGRIFS